MDAETMLIIEKKIADAILEERKRLARFLRNFDLYTDSSDFSLKIDKYMRQLATDLESGDD